MAPRSSNHGGCMKTKIGAGMVFLGLLLALSSHDLMAAAGKGAQAPDFALTSTAGRTVTLSDYKDKKDIIIMFWKTNGLYCPFELNNLKERYPGLQKEGFEVLAVNKKEASVKVKSFAEKEGLPFPVLLDEGGKVCDAYDIGGIPVFLIINKEGMITWRGYRFPERYAELAES